MQAIPLTPGTMYRIRTKSGRQTKEREHLVTYLSPNDGELLFNARPTAGTQSFAWGEICSIEAVRDNSDEWDSKHHYMNKVVDQVMHVLLTPPLARGITTDDNLGVLHVGCLPPFAQRAFTAMRAEGQVVTVITDPLYDFPETSPYRQRGQRYFDEFMAGHR